MPIATVICSAVVFVICALYFQRRHRALEARMTAQVKERYAAYVDLEERVRVALGEFDQLEASFEVEVRKSREQIKNLEQALNAVDGFESTAAPEMETPGGFLGVLDEGEANVQAQPITLTGKPHDFEAELQHWERKIEAAQNEKRTEIERQRQQIEDLTARLRQIEPTTIRRRDDSIAHSSTASTRHEQGTGTTSDLGQRIDEAELSARELIASLEGFLQSSVSDISNLRETLSSCKPLLEEQARARARGIELDREHVELEKYCAQLEQRCGELDGSLRDRDQELERAHTSASELEARGEESQRRLESANEELEKLRLDLQSERERTERESLACEELTRARNELLRSVTQLKSQLDEERTRGASLGGELEGARARLEQYEKQHAQLEARGREQSEVLQAQTEMLREREDEIGRLRARVGTLETRLTSTRDTIGGQKSRLVELMEAIQVTQKEQDRHKELLSEQSAHMREARTLLEQLRPVMDSLEGELEKPQSA